MQIPGAYHSILVSLATGSLVFAFLAIAYLFWLRPRWDSSEIVGMRLPISLYVTIFGIVMLLLSFSSGWLLRSPEALLNSPITKNKIIVSVLAIVCWIGFAVLRLKAGPDLLNRRDFRGHFAFVLALAGTLFLITTNSIGGDVGGIPSGYEEIGKALGFQTRHALYFPTWFNVIIVLIGVAALIGAFKSAATKSNQPSA